MTSSTHASIGVVRASADRERRVALDPDVTVRLTTGGTTVNIENGAGVAAGFLDDAYEKAGAHLLPRSDVIAKSDVIAVVRSPDADLSALFRRGQLVIGLIDPLNSVDLVHDLATRGVTVAAFELLPRTLSRAQSMDAVSSQASASGYRAGIVAAASFGRYLPMMITASGTARPASVIVVGTGVAGLQAIGTVKRLGAVVTGYDVRPASRGEVESLGALFLTSSIAEGSGAGGYARAMTAEEAVKQQDELAEHLTSFDIIITTAKVPGRTPPLLVTAATLAALRPGSVCIDMAATDQRGNVAGTVDGTTSTTPNGVVIVGAGNLASDLATSSSQMYARNVLALFTSLTTDGVVTYDPSDDVHSAVVVCHGGVLTNDALKTLIGAPVA